jgi:hypothetical protein
MSSENLSKKIARKKEFSHVRSIYHKSLQIALQHESHSHKSLAEKLQFEAKQKS